MWVAGKARIRCGRRKQNPHSSPLHDHGITMVDDSGQIPRLPPRAADSHKGDYGRALLIGGSRGMSGAIVLTGLGRFTAALDWSRWRFLMRAWKPWRRCMQVT